MILSDGVYRHRFILINQAKEKFSLQTSKKFLVLNATVVSHKNSLLLLDFDILRADVECQIGDPQILDQSIKRYCLLGLRNGIMNFLNFLIGDVRGKLGNYKLRSHPVLNITNWPCIGSMNCCGRAGAGLGFSSHVPKGTIWSEPVLIK